MSATIETHNTRLHVPALVLGILITAVGVSGFLDDSELLPHPPWFVAVVALLAACLAVAVHTLRRLLRSVSV